MTAEMSQAHLAYKEWQAKRLLAAVRDLPAEMFEAERGSSHGGIKGTLQHIYGADLVWLRRVKGEPTKRSELKLPETFVDLENSWLPVIAEWKHWAASIPADGWDEKITYVMFDGKQYSTPLWQIASHVVNHGTLHSGQVVAMLRQAGVTPPQTDIIFFYRELPEDKNSLRR